MRSSPLSIYLPMARKVNKGEITIGTKGDIGVRGFETQGLVHEGMGVKIKDASRQPPEAEGNEEGPARLNS